MNINLSLIQGPDMFKDLGEDTEVLETGLNSLCSNSNSGPLCCFFNVENVCENKTTINHISNHEYSL